MSKFISKIISLGLVTGMLFTSSAFAADPITATKEDTMVTVEVKQLDPGEETTLFVVDKGVTIEQAFADTAKVFYIDQTVADKNGIASFSFAQTDSAPLDIYSGYSSMSDTDNPYKTVLDESLTPEPPGDDEGEYILGDVNGDGQITGSDGLEIIFHFLEGSPFTSKYGELAGDVNQDGEITGTDGIQVIFYFLEGAPFTK